MNAAALAAGLLGSVQAVEVDVERGPVVELNDAVAGALGDEHGLADPAPAVPDADPERRVGAERGADDGVVQHLGRRTAGRSRSSAGRRPHSRRRAGPRRRRRVGAAHDLLLVAGEAVGEQEQHLVRASSSSSARQRRRLGARLAQAGARRSVATRWLDGEALAAEGDDDHAASPGPSVAISPAVEQPISGAPSETSLIPVRACPRSRDSDAKTSRSFAVLPCRAADAASRPAAAPWPTDRPAATQRSLSDPSLSASSLIGRPMLAGRPSSSLNSPTPRLDRKITSRGRKLGWHTDESSPIRVN